MVAQMGVGARLVAGSAVAPQAMAGSVEAAAEMAEVEAEARAEARVVMGAATVGVLVVEVVVAAVASSAAAMGEKVREEAREEAAREVEEKGEEAKEQGTVQVMLRRQVGFWFWEKALMQTATEGAVVRKDPAAMEGTEPVVVGLEVGLGVGLDEGVEVGLHPFEVLQAELVGGTAWVSQAATMAAPRSRLRRGRGPPPRTRCAPQRGECLARPR